MSAAELAALMREARESILRSRRAVFSMRDQNGTRAAIALCVHAIGCDDIPTPNRGRIAAEVEGWLMAVGMRR